MKTKLHSSFRILHSALAFLASLALCITALSARAQDTVTISAADFQRMVYAAHLHTQLALKPELGACLQTLLEMQRRNPNASPAALADLSRQTLQRYRTNAPAYIRTSGYPDEILAAYLEALRQVPARTNFVPANLTLLNSFMLSPNDYTNSSAAEQINSADQRLLSSASEVTSRQAVVDSCVARAEGNAAFATALDSVLLPETLVSLANTPAEIIGNTNSALYENPTMQTLLALSAGSGNGSLTVSSNQLMTLFTNETQTLWDTINTNLALQVEINQSQPDLLSYLTNQAAIDANATKVAAAQEGQARNIASATAAVLVQSKLMEAKDQLELPGGKLPKQIVTVVSSLGTIAEAFNKFNDSKSGKAAQLAASGNMLGASMQLFNLCTGAESPEDKMAREIGNVKTLIGDLSTNMNYRFDRVDQSLTTIFDTLNEQFDKIEITLDAQGRQIAHLNGNVDEIRSSLVDMNADLSSLERHLLSYVNYLYTRGLNDDFNTYLGYEATYGQPMLQSDYNITEADFFTQARNNSVDGLSSPYLDRKYTSSDLYSELTDSGGSTTNRLDQNLSYIKKYLNDVLGQSTAGNLGQLANPRDWFVGAYAYSQLAVENPMYFRQVNPATRLDLIAARGNDLTNFLRSLTFTGPNINSSLYTTLENYYVGKLATFNSQVSATETAYANDNHFNLGTWRQWDAAAPRVTTTTTAVRSAPDVPSMLPRDFATHIAAGWEHSLALKSDGTVVAWGDDTSGQTEVPAGLSDVTQIAAGFLHNLALKPDGTVVGWGDNEDCQTNTPAGLSNVVAVSAGASHNLALKTDHTVVGWGNNDCGQTNIPVGLTNVVAIAAGGGHSLALKADGSVVGWGLDNFGQATNTLGLSNVVAIAAGAYHSLALMTNGTVVAWGWNFYGQTSIPAGLSNVVAIAAGAYHSLALMTNGTVVAWGSGKITIPLGLTNVVAIAAGGFHSLALKADGTVVAWGQISERQCLVPPALTWHGAIAAGDGGDFLVLKADGTVAGWGNNNFGQTTIPASATNVLAIAAGNDCSLALKADGTVIGWGYNYYGEATGIPNTVYPYVSTGLVTVAGQTISNVVAIAAGTALKNDGTVVAWGSGLFDIPPDLGAVVAIAPGMALTADGNVVAWGFLTNIPASATNVVAIAAGYNCSLALKADGSVVGWGNNNYGLTNIPASATSGVVAIAAGIRHNLAIKTDGTVVAWGNDFGGGTNIPAGLDDVVAIAASSGADASWSLALKADGTVVGWGASKYVSMPAVVTNVKAVAAGYYNSLVLKADGTVAGGQATIPSGLSNVVAIAAGAWNSLALKTNGTVVGWGDNSHGQTSVPVSLSSVVAIEAGYEHSLALKADGTVAVWGANSYGETNIPAGLNNVLAIAAGQYDSLALKADGTVVGWGAGAPGNYGQTNIPAGLINVVAIAAGYWHSLALKADGTVTGWGDNYYGEATGVPTTGGSHYSSGTVTLAGQTLTNVVAIAAGSYFSVALKANGTIVGWGYQPPIPDGLTNVMAIAARGVHSLFLTASDTCESSGSGSLSFVRAKLPGRVSALIMSCNTNSMAELGRVGTLNSAAGELSGTKALLTAVLELGMPSTLERDDVLHGFLYGSESLVDTGAANTFLQAENAKLQATPDAPPPALTEVAALRYARFQDRLTARLNDLQATGQPEIPRLVGHTLRLLNLLRDSWTQPTNSPPPALELWSENNSPRLLLYGEPYTHYTLQYRDSLGVPGWTTTTTTNWHNEDIINPPVSGSPQRFYRAMLRTP